MTEQTQPTEEPKFKDYLPQTKPDVPARFTLRPYHYRPRYWQEQALSYWENPQRVARYAQVQKAQPPGAPPKPWLDQQNLDAAYKALQDYNKNEMWWNWKPLPFDHPLTSTLRTMEPPPLPLLTAMGEEKYYQPKEPEEIPSPALAGMTEEDWSKLPRWQRFLVSALQSPVFAGGMGALAGVPAGAAVAGPWGALVGGILASGASIYAQKHPDSTAASLLMYLDMPAEWVEQSIGLGTQIGSSVVKPEKYGDVPWGNWDELIKWLGAARRAGTLAYTAGGQGFEWPTKFPEIAMQGLRRGAGILGFGPPNLDILNTVIQADIALDPLLDLIPGWKTPPGLEQLSAPGQVWHFGDPLPKTVDQNMLAALLDARNRILQGEKPEDVIQEYTELYGATGQFRELVGHMVLDPLNVAPAATSKIGAFGAAKLGNVELATAFATTHGLTEAVQKYGTILRATKPISELSEAGAVTRMIAGVSKAGDVKIMAPATEGGGIFKYLLNLKPQSRATEVLNTSAVNLAAIMAGTDGTPETLTRIVKMLADTPEDVARELSMRSINAPDAAAIPMFLKDFGDTADEHLLKWEATDIQRTMLQNIADVTGKSDSEVLQQIANATDGEVLLRQFVDMAKEKKGEAAKAVVTAYEEGRKAASALPPEQRLTADSLRELVKVFIEDEMPHNEDMFRAQLYAAAMDKAADWAVEWFGVKPDPTWVRTSQTIKSAQSLMLLGLNPTYAVNNALNNTLTVAATGVFGIRSAKTIDAIWARAGIEPPRLRAGIGPVALGTELNYEAIRSAMQAPGTLSNITRFFNEKTGKIQIFTNLSMKHEQFASAQAYTAGFTQFMGRHWKEGVGFHRMPAALERSLTQLHPDLPKLIYSAIKGGMNQKEIEAALWSGLSRRSIDGAIPTLVDRLRGEGVNLSEADIRELLAHSGVDELLRNKLADAKSDADVNAIFNEANKVVQDRLDKAVAQDMERTASEVAQRISGGEGLPAVLELFDHQQLEFTERWFENFAEWEKAFTDTENMDYNSRNVVMQSTATKQRQKWNRYYTSERAKFQGMVKGLGLEGSDNRHILDLVDQAQQNHKDFFDLRNEKNKKFFGTKYANKQERQLAWDTLQQELLEAYQGMTSKELKIQDDLDEILIGYLVGKFGPEAGEAGHKWRVGVGEIRKNMIDEMNAMRDALRTMPVDERRVAWLQFLHGRDGYLTQIGEYFRKNVDGAHELYNTLRGRAGGEAGAPAAPSGEPPAGGAAPEVAPVPASAGASLPIMLTYAMKKQLQELGYSPADIRGMTPQKAWDILNENKVAEQTWGQVKPPEVPAAPEPPTAGLAQDLSPVGRKVRLANGATGIVAGAPKEDGGQVFVPVKMDTNNITNWVPLEDVKGIDGRAQEPVEIPTIQPPTSNQVFAENARIAAEAGIPLVDEQGNIISGGEIHLMNAIRKYGGPEAMQYNRVKDVPSEIVQKALDERALVKAEEAKKWGAELDKELEELGGVTPTEGEVHPIDQAILDNRLEDLPDDIRQEVEQAYGEMAAEVEASEKGARIFTEAETGGGPAVTGYKSTYPDWWSDLRNPFYKDAEGNKYTAKAAVVKVLQDLTEGKVNPKNNKGDNYVLVERAKGQVLGYMEGKRAYSIAKGEIDVSKQVKRLYEIRQHAKSIFAWDSPEKLQTSLNDVNEIIAEFMDYPYEQISTSVDAALDIQETLMNRIEELQRIPPEELTQVIDEAQRLSRLMISDYESRSQVHDYQMRKGIPPSELFQKPQQKGFWEAGEETPLFTGAAQRAQESVFKPTETPVQGRMPGFELQMKGAKPGGEATGPLFEASVQAGLFRRSLRQKFVDYFLSQQPQVISGAWDAQQQADAFLALADARANVWAKQTGREAWEWYPETFADVQPRKVDATNDTYLLGQIEASKGTPGYKAFAAGNKVVDPWTGDLIVVYHGTTHEFQVFDPNQGNIENFMGQAIYATDSIDDVNANYAGFGPDLTNRVENLADQIGDTIGDDPYPYIDDIAEFTGMTADQVTEKIDADGIYSFGEDLDEINKFIARKRIAGQSDGTVMPLYMRMENPAELKHNGGTYIDFSDVYNTDVDMIAENLQYDPEMYIDQIRQYYGYAEDWEPQDLKKFIEDDLYDIADEIATPEEETTFFKMQEALREALYDVEMFGDENAESIMGKVLEEHDMEGGYLGDIVSTIQKVLAEKDAYIDTGMDLQLGSSEITRRMLENMGYDGVIIDAGEYFPNMEGTAGANHYIVFSPNQVKSVFNMGDFDPNNPNIYYQRAFDTSPAWAGNEAPGVNVSFRDATEWSAGRFNETVVPILESEGGAYAIAQDPVGGYVLDSIFSGQQNFRTLHEARTAAWEEAFKRSRNTSEVLFQEVDPSPQWYYSPLKKHIQEKMPGRMRVGELQNFINKGGIKADELKWTGVDDWLATRRVIDDAIANGELIIKEDRLSDATYGTEITQYEIVNKDGTKPTIFGDYVSPKHEMKGYSDLIFLTKEDAEQFLSDFQGITKDQVLGYLDSNEVHVQEHVKGEPALNKPGFQETLDHVRAQFDQHSKEVFDPLLDQLADKIYFYAQEDGDINLTDARYIARTFAAGEDPLVADWVLESIGRDSPGFLDKVLAAGMEQRDYETTITNLQRELTPVRTSYPEYTLHGAGRAEAQNYRELLLTWNQHEKIPDTRGFRLGENLLPFETTRGGYLEHFYQDLTLEQAIENLKKDFKRLHENENLDRIETWRYIYRSGHWEEPNVMAHVRFSDYFDEYGRKVLYIDEVQSDWQQAARIEGTLEPPTFEEAKAALTEGWNLWNDYVDKSDKLSEVATEVESMALDLRATREEWVVKQGVEFADREGTGRELGVFDTPEKARTFYNEKAKEFDNAIDVVQGGLSLYKRDVRTPEYIRLQNELAAARKVQNDAALAYNEFKNNTWYPMQEFDQRGVPPAPFAKTWQDLAMKRMLRWAAERGYDRIAWSTGKIQNERWNLAQYYDRIEWTKMVKDFDRDPVTQKAINHKYDEVILQTYHTDGRYLGERRMSVEELPDYVGGDIAKRILEDPELKGTLQGSDDLAVGSQGMQFFYDNLIPKGMKKYGKKWGVEPEMGRIFTGTPGFEDIRVLNTTNEFVKVVWDKQRSSWVVAQKLDVNDNYHYLMVRGEVVTGDTPEQALINANWDDLSLMTGKDYTDVHSMDITPEMRSSVLQGQPLFSQKKGAVQFLKDGKAMVYALESPDISTMVHELGHVFRMDLRRTIDMAADEAIRGQLLADWETASKWAGAIEDDGEFLWSGEAAYKYGIDSAEYRTAKAAEEKFARGFEEYLMMGVAPTPELVSVFEKFKEWLAHIYARIKGDLAGVSPQMKEVYDRLLAEYPEAADYPITTEMGRAKVPTQGSMFQPAPAVNTENFRNWFKDSKVVDRWTGDPLVVYHGTTRGRDFQAFDYVESPWAFLLNEEQKAYGFYFTANKVYANTFASSTAPEAQGLIIPAYLSLQNPKIAPPGFLEEIAYLPDEIAKLRAQGYDGVMTKNMEQIVAFEPTQVKSVHNAGEWNPVDPNMLNQSLPLEYENGYKTRMLFQDEIPENSQPLGEVQSHSPGPPIGEMQDEAYRNNINPILTGLQELLTGPNAQVPDRVANLEANLDPGTMRNLRAYMGQVYGDLADTKLAGVRWAENRRDAALLNYSRRYGFDNFITAIFPYQFWYTRSALQWAMRFIDKPAWLAQYARIRNFQRNTIQTPGFPTRLRDKAKMPVPFLPEWANGGLYIDPFRQIFPFEQFAKPWEQKAQNKNMVERRAESIIQQWQDEGEEDPQALKDALDFRSGPMWEKAKSMAELDVESNTSNPWDFISLIMSPSLPIDIGTKWARGQKGRISQMPATRLIQNVSGALGANQGRGFNIEGPIRRALNMPEQDEFHDYRVDREISNLVAEGQITPEQANQAMVDQSGDAYLMAQQREAKTQQIKFLGAPLGADLFPEGEEEQRKLKTEYDKALEARAAGQSDALGKFFDKHPEYEARLLLFKEDPEERLRAYLRSRIWEAWLSEDIPELHKKQLKEQLGDVFTQAFLNKETRSYDSIDTPTLVQWAKLMNAAVPATAPETPAAQVQLADQDVTAAYQAFSEERDQTFPNIGNILGVLYEMPEEARPEFEKRFPEIDKYYQWRNKQFANHPEIIPYALSEGSKMAGAPPEVQTLYYQFQTERDQQFPNIFDIQDAYYQLTSSKEKKAFRAQYPQLPAYWEWRREFMRQYPQMIPYLMSEESLAEAVLGEEQKPSSGGASTSGPQYVTFEDGSQGWVTIDAQGNWKKAEPPAKPYTETYTPGGSGPRYPTRYREPGLPMYWENDNRLSDNAKEILRRNAMTFATSEVPGLDKAYPGSPIEFQLPEAIARREESGFKRFGAAYPGGTNEEMYLHELAHIIDDVKGISASPEWHKDAQRYEREEEPDWEWDTNDAEWFAMLFARAVTGNQEVPDYIMKWMDPYIGPERKQEQAFIDINQLEPALVRRLSAYYMFGEPLGNGATKNLRAYWESIGSPGGKLNEFIDRDLAQEF